MEKEKIIKILDKIIVWAFFVLIAAVTYSTSFTEASVGVIIGSWLIKKFVQKDITFPKHLFLAVFGVFLLWNLASFLNSSFLQESIKGFAKVIRYGLLLLIAVDTLRDARLLRKLSFFFIIWSMVIAANGIIQGWLGFDLIRLRVIDTLDYMHRIQSSFHHSNNFGVYLVVVIPVFLSFVFSEKIEPRKRIYFLSGLLPLFFCLVKTYSRGAWLSLFVSLFILALIKGRKIFAVFLILVIIGSFIMPHNAKERVSGLLNFKDGTNWERLKLWSGALNMIKKHPVLGFGVNTYTRNFPDYKPDDYWSSVYTHNCYLQMATEIGLVGLGLFLSFIILVFIYITRHLKVLPQGWMHSTVVGLFAGLIGFLIHSAVDTHLYSVNLAVMFYFLLGFTIALCNYAKANPA
ncbi:MAG: O-antigen ligase family protein [Candidatus Omnitrophota bacterium]